MFPLSKTLCKKFSSVSGKIVVEQKGEERRLVVGGRIQSINRDAPGIKGRVWGRMLAQIKKQSFRPSVGPPPAEKVKNCLILGLGGATAAHLLVKRYPQARLVGVEIDPAIVEVGKRYFELDKIENLRIVVADAFAVVRRPQEYRLAKGTFDFALVDIYLGRLFPREFESFGFFENLKNLLRPGGVLVVNRIFSLDEKIEKKRVVDRLAKLFNNILVEEVKGMSKERNFILSARKF